MAVKDRDDLPRADPSDPAQVVGLVAFKGEGIARPGRRLGAVEEPSHSTSLGGPQNRKRRPDRNR